MPICRIVTGPIDAAEAVAAVAGPGRGAVATFEGRVRNHHRGRAVVSLEYQAYAPMAERTFREIAVEAEARFGPMEVAILHRVGRLEVGETSVLIAVAAAHRRPALEACATILDRVKALAPIWKRERGPGGDVWLEGPEPAEGLPDRGPGPS